MICPPPPISEFGALSYHRVKPGNISVFEDEIKFECLLPLALIGNETAECLASGKWSEIPECRSKYSNNSFTILKTPYYRSKQILQWEKLSHHYHCYIAISGDQCPVLF